jgi:hypothetical protein
MGGWVLKFKLSKAELLRGSLVKYTKSLGVGRTLVSVAGLSFLMVLTTGCDALFKAFVGDHRPRFKLNDQQLKPHLSTTAGHLPNATTGATRYTNLFIVSNSG